MSAPSPASVADVDTSTRRRRRRLWVLALLALVLGVVLAGPPAGEEALDPRSAGPQGLRGLVDLAEAFDAEVVIASSPPADTSTRVLVASDELTPDARDRLLAWVDDGGLLVVADAASPLHDLEAGAEAVSDLVGPRGRSPDCDLAAMTEVGEVSHAGWRGFAVPEDAGACFPVSDDEAWLVTQPHGEGRVVALGSPSPLVNAALDRDDNAVLAAALLFPDPQATLRIVEPEPEAPPTGPGELIPPRLWHAAGLLAVAALVTILAIGRRLGRPVEERLPPTLPSAELTRSVGDLLQRAGSAQGAADRLRARARAEVGRQLGTDLPADALARQATARLAIEPDTARRALVDDPVTGDDGLVEVARAVAELRERLRAPS